MFDVGGIFGESLATLSAATETRAVACGSPGRSLRCVPKAARPLVDIHLPCPGPRLTATMRSVRPQGGTDRPAAFTPYR